MGWWPCVSSLGLPAPGREPAHLPARRAQILPLQVKLVRERRRVQHPQSQVDPRLLLRYQVQLHACPQGAPWPDLPRVPWRGQALHPHWCTHVRAHTCTLQDPNSPVLADGDRRRGSGCCQTLALLSPCVGRPSSKHSSCRILFKPLDGTRSGGVKTVLVPWKTQSPGESKVKNTLTEGDSGTPADRWAPRRWAGWAELYAVCAALPELIRIIPSSPAQVSPLDLSLP